MKVKNVIHTKQGIFYGKAEESNEVDIQEVKDFFENFKFSELKYLTIKTDTGFIYFNPDNVIGVEIETIEEDM